MLRFSAGPGRVFSSIHSFSPRSRLPSSMAMNIVSGGGAGGSGRYRLLDNHVLRANQGIAANFATEVSRKANESENVHEQKGAGRKGMSLVERIFHPKAAEAASQDYNRWAVVAPAFMSHVCIGSPWAWSVLSGPLSRNIGVVASSPSDWSMFECTLPLGIVFAFQGISAAFLGSWAMRLGPRAAMSISSLCFGGGLVLGGLGVHLESLPLLYAGYGVLGGAGVGLAYTPPVQTLISWFPDKTGLASGLTIAGFGSGALVFTSLVNQLMDYFYKAPTCLTGDVMTQLVDGKLISTLGEKSVEVVRVTAGELASLPYEGLTEGLYAVGTGSTGVAESLAVSGALYTAIMLACSFTIRTPPPGYKPDGWEPPPPKVTSDGDAIGGLETKSMTPNNALRTPQFYLLGTHFFCLATGGMGLMSVAKPMLGDLFSSVLPGIVTAAFASQYVQIMAVGNLGGRVGWAAISDSIGRRNTFNMFTTGSLLLYAGLPFIVHSVVDTGSSLMLYGFIGATATAISFMGGTFSILPAYESDLFGSKYVGPIHGRMLLFSTASALVGPSIILKLTSAAESNAIQGLLAKVVHNCNHEVLLYGAFQCKMMV